MAACTRRIRTEEAGLTLLELMFAAGVMAMALSLLFGSLISVSVIGRINESRTEAVSVLSSVLEEVRTMPLQDLQTYAPPQLHGPGESYLVELACYAPKMTSEDEEQTAPLPTGEFERMTFPLPTEFDMTTLPNPLEVEVTVRWREANERVFQARSSFVRER